MSRAGEEQAPVRLVGAAHRVRPRGERLEETVWAVSRAALDAAGLRRDQLDSVVLAASDELDGRGITSMLMAMPAGGYHLDVNKVTDGGLHALALAAMKIRSGAARVVVVVAWDGSGESPHAEVERTALEPFVEKPLGIVDPVATATLAQRHLHLVGTDTEALDRWVAPKWASLGVEPDESWVALPLRRSHLAPPLATAAAVVVASDEACDEIGLAPRADLRGVGWVLDGYEPLRRRPMSDAVAVAVDTALRAGGASAASIDHHDLDDTTALHEVMAVEGAGLAAPGRALAGRPSFSRLADDGFAGLPRLAAGLGRIAQGVARGSGGRQLVHESIGRAGQGHVVALVDHLAGGRP